MSLRTRNQVANRRGNLPAMVEEHQQLIAANANSINETMTTSSNETELTVSDDTEEPVAELSTSSQEESHNHEAPNHTPPPPSPIVEAEVSKSTAAKILDHVSRTLPGGQKKVQLTSLEKEDVQKYVTGWRQIIQQGHREVADALKSIDKPIQTIFRYELQTQNLAEKFSDVQELLGWLEMNFKLLDSRDAAKSISSVILESTKTFVESFEKTGDYRKTINEYAFTMAKFEDSLPLAEKEEYERVTRSGQLYSTLIDQLTKAGRKEICTTLGTRMKSNTELKSTKTQEAFFNVVYTYANKFDELALEVGRQMGVSSAIAAERMRGEHTNSTVKVHTSTENVQKKKASPNLESQPSKKKAKTNEPKAKAKSSSSHDNERCRHCGKYHPGDCHFKTNGHPDCNKSSEPFAESKIGKKYAAIGKDCLMFKHQLNDKGSELIRMNIDTGSDSTQSRHFTKGENTNESRFPEGEAQCAANLMSLSGGEKSSQEDTTSTDHGWGAPMTKIHRDIKSSPLLEVDDGIISTAVVVTNGDEVSSIPVMTLLDTGSNVYDFCSYRLMEQAVKLGGIMSETNKVILIGDQIHTCTKELSVSLKIFDKLKNVFENIEVKLCVMSIPYDIIIGRRTLARHTILKQVLFQDLLSIEDLDTWIVPLMQRMRRDLIPAKQWTTEMIQCEIKETLAHLRAKQSEWDQQQQKEQIARQEYKEFQRSFEEKLEQLYPQEVADESKRHKKRRLNFRNSAKVREEVTTLLALTKPPDLELSHDDSTLENEAKDLPTELGNDNELKERLGKLVYAMADTFSRQLRREAALVPPMHLKVADAWNCAENRRSPRIQGGKRNNEIDVQTKQMEEFNVIRLSTASAHSQVLLTPKPDGTWRFCVDFRRLNEQTKSESWPIPNIQEMIRRIGSNKPRYFGVIDLTKGYYQAPLSESSKHYTAFITSCALYEWNRVPMGLMGAPSYFQRIMTTVVLAGLMYNTCEVYLDDIIVWGRTKDEYVNNVRKVLERLRKHKLTANPKKTKLGLEKIEYVGHEIDHEKVVFDRARLQKIIDFPQPSTLGQLKKFLGMAGYVRDSVVQAAERTTPLTELFDKYSKKKKHHKIVWNEKLISALEEVKKGVNESQALFFLDETSPVHLYTDASEYGIGAWLVQEVGKKKRTISLMSKTLTKTQRKWHIPEKEAYAIVVALQKFEYLIRDVHFTLHTDHKNLVYIRDTGSPKVVAWKCKVQEYDFDVAFIPGEDNTVADELSRNPDAELAEEEPDPYVVTDLENIDLHENDHMAAFVMSMTAAQREIVESVHNSETGHHGVENTMAKLKKTGHEWKDIRKDVSSYIKQCDTCQKRSHRNMQHDVAPYTTVTTRLMKNRSIDTVGPFQEDEEGNKYLAVIIDTFSRWVEIYRIKNNDALSTAEALYENYGRFGAPEELKSDHGSEYVNELVTLLNERVGVKHNLTIPYSHEENGIVENANREIRKFISDLCYDKRLSKIAWSRDIPSVMRVLNTTPKTMTGMSPAYMLYAGSIDLDNKLFKYNVSNEEKSAIKDDALSPWSDWLANRQLAQKVALAEAKKRTIAHEETHMSNDSGKRTEFPIGSLVYKAYAPSKYGGGKPSKQDLNWTGPYRVKSFKGSAYILEDILNNKTLAPVEIHRLKACDYDPVYINPLNIRMKDFDDQYEVEEVLSHVGDFSQKKTLYFKVKWTGYEEITSEPWSNLRDNQMLHTYLKQKGLNKHIPTKYKRSNKESEGISI